MRPILRLLLIAFVNLLIFAGCRCKNCCEVTSPPIQKEAPYSGINVKIPAGKSLSDLTNEIYVKLNIRIDTKIHVRTCPCDTALVNINYPGLDFWGQGPRIPSNPTVPGRGDTLDLPGFVASKNYEIVLDEKDSLPEDEKYGKLGRFSVLASFANPTSITKTVTVAIFDSGLDDQHLSKNFVGVKYDFPACFTDSLRTVLKNGGALENVNGSQILKGLNFAPADFPSNTYDISNILDTHPGKHGTNVASLVVQQFGKTTQTKAIKLLIMRVLNNQNKGDAFGIMCAVYHAKQMGAEVYNMSLGYYGAEDPIFKSYIDLIGVAPKRGWVVAAAGNAAAGYDIAGIPVDDPKNRNLDERIDSSKLYPAYFSKTMKHVVSATTILNDTSAVCERQNYDPNSLDIGVVATNCIFKIGNSQPLRGTSFATPVAAGWIAAQQNLSVPKTNLLAPAPTDSRLIPFIRKGKFIQYKTPI